MSFVLIAILIYLGFLFIVRFVIPVYLATRKFKKGFREMKDRMEQHIRQQQGQAEPEAKPQTKASSHDYIDFEEVK